MPDNSDNCKCFAKSLDKKYILLLDPRFPEKIYVREAEERVCVIKVTCKILPEIYPKENLDL